MKAYKFLTGLLLSCALAGGAHGASMTQDFDSAWTVSPWDYNGDVAAQQWQYLNYVPWDGTFGTLLSVSITTSVDGNKDVGDVLSYRYALFTGWSPNQYQFFDAASVAAGMSTFSATRSFVSGTDFALSNFLSYLYLPQAYYYFESRTDNTHIIRARTELVYNYAPGELISEPASELLMLIALGVLAIMVRRRMPD